MQLNIDNALIPPMVPPELKAMVQLIFVPPVTPAAELRPEPRTTLLTIRQLFSNEF